MFKTALGDWRAEVPLWAYDLLNYEDAEWRTYYKSCVRYSNGDLVVCIGNDVYVLGKP